MQKHDIKTIDELTEADKGQWRDCDIDVFHTEYFEDVDVIDKPEFDYGIYTANYFKSKFPGLPEEAYDVLASERHRLDNVLREMDSEIETTTFTPPGVAAASLDVGTYGENKLIIVE